MEVTKTKHVEVIVLREQNSVVVKCGPSSITYPLDEMKLIFRTLR